MMTYGGLMEGCGGGRGRTRKWGLIHSHPQRRREKIETGFSSSLERALTEGYSTQTSLGNSLSTGPYTAFLPTLSVRRTGSLKRDPMCTAVSLLSLLRKKSAWIPLPSEFFWEWGGCLHSKNIFNLFHGQPLLCIAVCCVITPFKSLKKILPSGITLPSLLHGVPLCGCEYTACG